MKAKFYLPLVLFMVLCGMFLYQLVREDYDKGDIPSPLIGKPAPAFELPYLHDQQRMFTPEDMKGQVWLLNIWASWCTTCNIEHPIFVDIARKKLLPIVGMDYKDDPEAGKAWLMRGGNPYDVVIMDREGRIAIDYGLYGVPESYLIDKQGIIRYKQIGAVTPKDWEEKLLPKIKELQAQ